MADLLAPALGGPAGPARGCWTPLRLACAAVLVAWESARSLGERLAAACQTLDAMFPGGGGGGGGGGGRARLGGATYQGWAKALAREADLHERVADRLRALTRDLGGGRCWRRDGQCAFAVDGTRVDCPRTAANRRALRRAGRTGTGPQLYLTVLYHVGTGLPWAWRVGRSTADERRHLRAMLGLLPAGAVVVADAAFVGYELLRRLRRRGLHFLVRAGANVNLLTGLACVRREGRQAAYLWPGGDRRRPGRRRSSSPLPVRLIRVARARRTGERANAKAKVAWLVTDLPARALSDAAAGRLYALRWGVEVFFRSFKQKLGRRRMCSRTPARARRELHWSVIGLWAAQLLAVRAVVAAGRDPLSWSLAAAMRVLRAAARGDTPARPRSLAPRLAACRRDAYRRTRPKAAHGYPHKKTDRPPGAPNVRPATPAEVLNAKEVYDARLVA
jgi:hypothetical protein